MKIIVTMRLVRAGGIHEGSRWPRGRNPKGRVKQTVKSRVNTNKARQFIVQDDTSGEGEKDGREQWCEIDWKEGETTTETRKCKEPMTKKKERKKRCKAKTTTATTSHVYPIRGKAKLLLPHLISISNSSCGLLWRQCAFNFGPISSVQTTHVVENGRDLVYCDAVSGFDLGWIRTWVGSWSGGREFVEFGERFSALGSVLLQTKGDRRGIQSMHTEQG